MINKEEFINNFAIELTNTTLFDRKKIAEKYYLIIDNLKAENERLQVENEKLKKALEDIEEIAYTTDFDIVDIQEIVDEVLDD